MRSWKTQTNKDFFWALVLFSIVTYWILMIFPSTEQNFVVHNNIFDTL